MEPNKDINNLNGRGTSALEDRPEEIETAVKATPVAEPETPPAQLSEIELPHPATPKKPSFKMLIAAVLGTSALAAGGYFGYNYWQFASSHEETENATVSGHIHQVSSRINGTVATVPVLDNQLVKEGDLLLKLDPRDYEIKVQQAQAALENARASAEAAQANIALASQTTEAKTTQAQGDVSGASAAIASAQALLQEAQAGVPAAEAAVQEAEAGVQTAQAAVAEAQAGVPAAEAQLAQVEANLHKTEVDYNRYSTLFESGAIARQQLDAAKAAYEVAKAQRNAAQQGIQQAQAKVQQAQQNVARTEAQLAKAREGVAGANAKVAQAQEGVATAQAKLAASKGGLQQATAGNQQTEVNRNQYQAAQASISQAEAALKDAQQQLSYTNIISPATGRLGRKNVEVGQRVAPGTALMAIVSDENWVIANFKETQLERMKPGQEVEIKLDAFPHLTFKGKVDSFSPASGSQFALLPPDNATGNFTKVVQRVPVKVVFDGESIKGYESRIVPGMSAVVSVSVR